MRLLFSFAGRRGHFEPLAPIARAAVAAGHTVAFACSGLLRPVVEAAGFDAFEVAPTLKPAQRLPLRPVDLAHEDRVLRETFAGRMARERAVAMLALLADRRPDVLVCDEFDLGSMVAAERLGIPYATVLENASGSLARPQVIAEPAAALRSEHGVPPDGTPALVLSPFPPSLRDPAFPLPAGAVSLRPSLEPGPAPDWIGELEDAVLFTLGTVFNLEAGDLFARVLAGLRPLGAGVVVTVGHGLDPAELGPQPPHVRVERFIPLAAVLPRCRAVVSHGGSGTLAASLVFGLPSVLLPMGADQPGNAARAEALGAARVLDVTTATPAQVGEAVTAVLERPAHRAAAEALRDEIAALPGPDHAVALLNTLAA